MKLFNPTRSDIELNGIDYRLWRDGKWSTNGFWLLLSKNEPDFVSCLKSTKDHIEGVDKIINDSEEAKNELKLTNKFILQGDTLYQIMECEGYKTLINPYFLRLITDPFELRTVKFKQKYYLSAIYFYHHEELIGVVMPAINESND